LDIPTLIALEEYLDDFAGALIVVSHDRYFLDRTIDSVFKFQAAGKIREYAGDYSAYLDATEREKAEEAETRAKASVTKTQSENSPSNGANSAAKKLTFKEKRELETLEKNIPEIEKRLVEIENELNQFAADAYKVNQLYTEQQQMNETLEKDLERWTELAERDA
jgi:ATP-binding cassette subfamily F protein uup